MPTYEDLALDKQSIKVKKMKTPWERITAAVYQYIKPVPEPSRLAPPFRGPRPALPNQQYPQLPQVVKKRTDIPANKLYPKDDTVLRQQAALGKVNWREFGVDPSVMSKKPKGVSTRDWALNNGAKAA
jgi:hypothetical protein